MPKRTPAKLAVWAALAFLGLVVLGFLNFRQPAMAAAAAKVQAGDL
jgi:hypothetical protein